MNAGDWREFGTPYRLDETMCPALPIHLFFRFLWAQQCHSLKLEWPSFASIHSKAPRHSWLNPSRDRKEGNAHLLSGVVTPFKLNLGHPSSSCRSIWALYTFCNLLFLISSYTKFLASSLSHTYIQISWIKQRKWTNCCTLSCIWN